MFFVERRVNENLSAPKGGTVTIRVEIGGKRAVVLGSGGPLVDEIAAALARNGAAVRRAEIGQAEAFPAHSSSSSPPTGPFDAASAEAVLRDAFAGMGDGGRMIIVASALGLVPGREEAAELVRAAGLFALARTLAMEFAARRIAVNAVAVGPVEGDAGISARMISHVPLHRGARPTRSQPPCSSSPIRTTPT